MEKRQFAKFATQTIVAYTANVITQRVVRQFLPKSEAVMAPQIAGALVGYYVSETYKENIGTIVDGAYDALAKTKSNTN